MLFSKHGPYIVQTEHNITSLWQHVLSRSGGTKYYPPMNRKYIGEYNHNLNGFYKKENILKRIRPISADGNLQ